MSLPVDGSAREVHDIITGAFPPLVGTGHELLRVEKSGGRDLEVMKCPDIGFSVDYLKASLGQAKCYLRPIQFDICLHDKTATEEGALIDFYTGCNECRCIISPNLPSHVNLYTNNHQVFYLPIPHTNAVLD